MAFHGDTEVGEDIPAGPPEISEGQRVGPYEVLERLGEGGMGAVFLAARADEQFDQRVALKVVRPTMSTEFILGRFRRERQILARLEHPHIARLLDGGSTSEGLPYFVMEYVAGLPIDRYCDERALPLKERLELFCKVCDAVQFAHQNLVVHRDLKPANILVSQRGDPKLLDFGIAKLLAQTADGEIKATRTAVRLMTPEYASPEQIHGEPITTATDVYSLGVILHELLTGQRPQRRRAAADAPTELVVDDEPERASAIVSRPASSAVGDTSKTAEVVAERRRSTPARLRRQLRGDLDNIVQAAIRRKPEQRYASAQQLAADVRNYLLGRPVTARGDTMRYRVAKFVRRHRLLVSAFALTLASLVAGILMTSWQARVARQERERAERRFHDVRKLSNALIFDIHDAIAPLAGSTRARSLVVREALRYLDSLSREAADDYSLLRELASAYRRIGDVQGNPANPNLGDRKGAQQSYAKALALRLDLLKAHPNDGKLRRQTAETYSAIGDMRWAADDIAGAEKSYLSGIDVLGPLLRQPGHQDRAQRMLGILHMNLGDCHRRRKRAKRALESYRKALALQKAVLAKDPENTTKRRVVAFVWSKIAMTQTMARDIKGALESHRRSLELRELNRGSQPKSPRALRDVSTGLGWLGNTLTKAGNLDGALSHYRKALAIDEALLATDPSNVQARRDVGVSHMKLGDTLKKLGKQARKKSKEAEAHFIGAGQSYRNALEVFEQLRRKGQLAGYDANVPATLRKAITECTAAIQ